MKNQITNKERWRVSLHEAGHCQVGIMRTSNLYKPSMSVAVFENGEGLCSNCGKMTDFNDAIMRAAGAQAERLRHSYKAPVRRNSPPTPEDINTGRRLPREISSLITKNLKDCHSNVKKKRRVSTDDYEIAKYCIWLYPRDFDKAKRKCRRIKAIARYETWMYREQIIHIAKQLFQDGAYFAAAEKDPHPQTENYLLPVELTDVTNNNQNDEGTTK